METQIEKLLENLEQKYKVNPEAFLELYKEGLGLVVMAETLNVTEWTIRIMSSTMNLRLPKKYRQNDLALFLSRYSESAETRTTTALIESDENLDHLSKQLIAKEKTILGLKQEVTKYRKGLKQEVSVDSMKEFIAAAVTPLESHEVPKALLKIETNNKYEYYTQLLLLSDCHVEETVSHKDVGLANRYSWDIMTQRLGRVFSELLNAYRGEGHVIVASLGDQFSGVIYDTMEHTGKSLGEAVRDFAYILANYLKSLAVVYESVYVPVVHGNHGRLGQHKKSAGYGTNNFEYLMANILKALVADTKNITIDISTTGMLAFEIGEATVGCHHGDFFRSVGDAKFLRVKEHFKQTLGVEPDVILQGHTHVFNVEQMPRSGTYITNASLIGVSGYTHTNGFVGKNWGQVLMSFLPSGKVENVRLVGDE